jgi:hypothetical protein
VHPGQRDADTKERSFIPEADAGETDTASVSLDQDEEDPEEYREP